MPTDCPQRDERLGWTGDAQVFILSLIHIFSGFKVVETYQYVDEQLHWEVTVENTGSENMIVGDWGMPMPFNELLTGGPDDVYEKRAIDHSFVGLDSSYISVSYTHLGNKTDSCVVTVEIPEPGHVHDDPLKKVEEKPATCTQEGNKAYYVCESCGTWFEDAAGEKPITDHDSVILPKTEHTPSDWKADADNHWKECTECKMCIRDRSISGIAEILWSGWYPVLRLIHAL